MGMVDSVSFFLLESNGVARDVAGWRCGRPTCTCFSFPLVSLDGRHHVMAVLRSVDDHVHLAAIIIITFVILSSPSIFTRLIPLRRIL